MAKVLIADDEKSIRIVLRKFLESLGHNVVEASNGNEALEMLNKSIDIAFVDINMPDLSGLEILERVKNVPIIIVTAYGTMDYTVKAVKLGAVDYIVKPFDLDDIKNVINRVLRESFKKPKVKVYEYDDIVGSSKKMQDVFKLIGKVSGTDATILITGESGTGKELVARAIHKYSNRKNKPFVAINCAALPANLLESELFGYERGAFTGANTQKKGYFEQANEGTLFLDEIGELDLNLQSKILRAIQEREIVRVGGRNPIKVNVRILAATNKDLESEVGEGRFREDLYYRLNVIRIKLPALRERRDDILPLANYFISKFSRNFKLPFKTLTDKAVKWLLSYNFPGNVRELENIILRAMILTTGDVIDACDLNPHLLSAKEPNFEEAIREFVTEIFTVEQKEKNNLYKLIVGSAERILISEVLKYCDFNQVKASKVLGIHRNTLRKKIKEYKITIPE